ncbi:hypothetical protein HYT51_00975, partial [Candidatus Woesearchaeota archaeon]|nr:hypothetical protein [Candidatus Woesearchaeota archaeon]
SKLNEEDLKEYFDLIKKETNNFTNFTSNLLIRIPQSILIFRIIFCLSYRRAAKLLCEEGSIKNYEHLKCRVKPITAITVMNKIKELFENSNYRDISYEKFLENHRILSGFYGCRDLDFLIDQGLSRLAKINPTKFEEELYDLLKDKINVKRYHIIKGVQGKYNVDFFIETKNKKIAIETFCYSNCKKKGNIKTKTSLVDHRFQSLKLEYPDLVTIMCVKIVGKPILEDYVKRYLKIELMNTDYFLLNGEVKKLLQIVDNI